MVFRFQKRYLKENFKKILFVLILVSLNLFIFGCEKQEDTTKTEEVIQIKEEVTNKQENNIKTFVVTGENFKFLINGKDNLDLNVKDSEKVRIEFTSTVGFHDFVIDEFQAATKKVKVGESTFVEFIANKKGIFEYYCSVGTHRQQGMKGKLIVE